ncbi:MAG: flagellar export chaperone FliS [Dehalococcoidia bacterium]
MVAGGQHTYRRIQFETASPAELILRLYDALARDLERAETALSGAAIEEAHAALIHAQEIVIELLASLDMSASEISQQLADLYQYWYQRLVQANVAKDASAVGEILRLLRPIHRAWSEATCAMPQQRLAA